MASGTGKQTIIIWILTIVITLASVVYQRVTGPTYPVHDSIDIGGESIHYKLLQSHVSSADAIISIGPVDDSITGTIRWRRLHSADEWNLVDLAREGDKLTATIPKQPPAGKVAYEITLTDGNGRMYPLTEKPVVMRFKGDVPIVILLLHIIAMFISMLLGTRSGIEAVYKRKRSYRFALWTTGLFIVGGIIFGPIVQNYAFGSYWTGWPIGTDLTDNKTAVALLGWLLALWRGRNPRTGLKWFIIAAALQLLVFLIPHSLLGSELDYTQMNQQP